MLDSLENLSLEEQRVKDYFLSLQSNGTPSKRIPERIVSAAWFDGAFQSEHLCTNDARELEVIAPGRWNEGPGPDFLEAEIKISGRKRIRGDVEIEVFTSDWDKHRHKKSSDFGNVILRVCLWNDINKPLKSKIPLLVLSPFIEDIEKLASYNTNGYPFASPTMRGACQKTLTKIDRNSLEALIESEGRNRLELKAYRFGMLARTFGKEQAIYRGVMEAMGYSMNKDPMSRLADSVNMEFINKHISPLAKDKRQRALQAALFAHCGAFSDKPTVENNPELQDLQGVWNGLNITDNPVIIEGFRLARTRPANNPFRRLTAMSHIMTRLQGFQLYKFLEELFNPRVEEFDAKQVVKKLTGFFTNVSDEYWENHSGLNPQQLKKTMALVGKGTATTIIANIVLPFVLGTLNRKENVWKVTSQLKGIPHNQKTRFICVRMFGPEMAQPPFARRLLINQGLIQLFEDHCKKLLKECPECKIKLEF